MDERIRTVLEAVAKLDVFYEGDNDWPYCPFDCDRDALRNQHDEDCPISVARAITGLSPHSAAPGGPVIRSIAEFDAMYRSS